MFNVSNVLFYSLNLKAEIKFPSFGLLGTTCPGALIPKGKLIVSIINRLKNVVLASALANSNIYIFEEENMTVYNKSIHNLKDSLTLL